MLQHANVIIIGKRRLIYTKMRKLYLSKNLNLDDKKVKLVSDFCVFCASSLPVKKDFEIYVVNDRSSHDISTTAVYHLGRNVVKVYAKNRALVDVCRSIAHEMTHMMQDESGLIDGPVQDAGGFHEDQANAKAGELIKLFAKSDNDRKAIYEIKYI